MEHKIVGNLAMGVLFISVIAGGLSLGRHCPIEITAQQLKRMPLVLVPLWLILEASQYYLENFMTDGKASISRMLVSDGPVFAVFGAIWIGAYIKQKSALIAEEKAAPTRE